MAERAVGIPEVGTAVVLVHLDANSYPSRVEDVAGDRLTVGMPTDLLAVEPYEPGAVFELTWTRPSGIHILPVALVGTRTEQRIRLWDLSVVEEGWVDQRREYVRVPISGSVAVGAGATALRGSLADLSEAAMQCVLDVAYDDPRLTVGNRMDCQLIVQGECLLMVGIVESAGPGDKPDQSRVVMRLEVSEQEADRLRKQVFAAQLEQRRAQRKS